MSKFYQNKNKTITIYHSQDLGWSIHLGIECGNSCYCKFQKKCKYRPRFRKHYWHNVRWFFEHRLHIILPHSRIWFGRNRKELSGTDQCPFGTTLETGCHRCVHCCGADEYCHLLCGLKTRGKAYDDGFWHYQCPDFKEWDN